MKIQFYEKPGCINNTKQKALLEEHGYDVEALSVLDQEWSYDTLRPFFGNMPIKRWFNLTAPSIKSGQITPEDYVEKTAIDAMINDPLLIRRPLLSIDGHRVCGFDHPKVQHLLNDADVTKFITCPQTNNKC